MICRCFEVIQTKGIYHKHICKIARVSSWVYFLYHKKVQTDTIAGIWNKHSSRNMGNSIHLSFRLTTKNIFYKVLFLFVELF